MGPRRRRTRARRRTAAGKTRSRDRPRAQTLPASSPPPAHRGRASRRRWPSQSLGCGSRPSPWARPPGPVRAAQCPPAPPTSSAPRSRRRRSSPRSACRSASGRCGTRSRACLTRRRLPEHALAAPPATAPGRFRAQSFVYCPAVHAERPTRQRVVGGGTTYGPSGPQGRIGPVKGRSAPARARQLTP
jgi:hypothetical protein